MSCHCGRYGDHSGRHHHHHGDHHHGHGHGEGCSCHGGHGHEGHGECCRPCRCHDGGGCCGGGRHGGGHHRFERRFKSKAEKIARLEAYLADLKAELQAVEERLGELRR